MAQSLKLYVFNVEVLSFFFVLLKPCFVIVLLEYLYPSIYTWFFLQSSMAEILLVFNHQKAPLL